MNENEMQLLENRLRFWQPRRPFPRLKRRLFGTRVRHHSAEWSLRWMATAAACLLLAVMMINQDPGFSRHSSAQNPMMGLICSNLSSTNILPGSRPQGRSCNLPASFEWTNLSGFTSSISPFSPGRVN